MFSFFFCYFIESRLGSEITPRQQLKEQAAGVMQQLLTLVQYTAVSPFFWLVNCLKVFVITINADFVYIFFYDHHSVILRL